MIDLGPYFNRFPQIILGPCSSIRRKNKNGFCTTQKPQGMVAYRVVKRETQWVCEIYADFQDKKKSGRKKLNR